ncbi:MAG: fibronectin type III domain-containing protein, partial [Oscillospiraceae bacterium]|nr:fibronectin type III domain-containing protein [Oscillospiraceae bacterium]
MKRRRLLSLIGGVLCLAMLATAILPNLFTFAAPALEVLNPWGEIQPQKNLPLAERPDTLDDGKIGLLYFDKFGGAEFTAAIKTQLQTNYTGVTFEETELDSQYAFAQSKDWYDDKSEEYDAVLISGANDGTTAYWAACHAREFEKRGVPVVIAVLSTYVPTLALAAEDYGITALRSVAIPIEGFTKAYKDIAAMIVPIAQSLSSGIESALTDPLTDDEMDPDPIKPADALENIAIPSGISFEKQLQYFNSYAMEQGFGDGLPLTLPTKTAVDRMLAATVRNPDEVLGKLRMRYGICTIEKIAINAVMAGAEPEYFPVIIAAMEALCDGIEDKSLYHAALTSSDNYMLMLVLSGPIAKDLDFATDRGYMTSGLRNNNTIGRAVMLSFRNIGHNTTPYVDTNRYGRHQDHTGLVFTENEAQFPPNWPSHGESMGFDKNQSSVTVVAIGRMGQDDNWINNEPFGYNISELLLAPGQQMLLNKQRNATTNNILRLANLPKEPKSSKDIMMYTLSPAHAALLLEKPENPGSDGKLYSTASHDFGQEIPAGSGIGAAQGVNKTKMGLNTKEEIRDWWTLNGVKNGTTGIGGTTSLTMANVANPDIPFAANKNIVQLLLVGENPTYALIYESKFLGADAYRTQLITGATKTNAGQDATAPSQPQNFKVLSDGADKVDLSWSAPARTNGSVTYEVSSDDGATWKKAGAETSYTFEDLNPDEEYSFVVR